MNKDKKTIVYILSSAHSGSTLVDLILGAHSKCSSLGEFRHISKRLGKQDCLCAVCKDSCSVWDNFKVMLEGDKYHKAAFDAFKTPILIDSSKDISWLKQTKDNYNIKIIKITRNGLATCNKAKRKLGRLDKYVGINWALANIKIDKYCDKVKKITYFLKYEDLCENLECEIKSICDFIGINFEQIMLEFWKKHQHPIGGNAKPISLVQLYHKTRILDELHPDVSDFFNKTGFNVKLDRRYEYKLTDEEKIKFNKSVSYLSNKYGYAPKQQSSFAFWFRIYKYKLQSFVKEIL